SADDCWPRSAGPAGAPAHALQDGSLPRCAARWPSLGGRPRRTGSRIQQRMRGQEADYFGSKLRQGAAVVYVDVGHGDALRDIVTMLRLVQPHLRGQHTPGQIVVIEDVANPRTISQPPDDGVIRRF